MDDVTQRTRKNYHPYQQGKKDSIIALKSKIDSLSASVNFLDTQQAKQMKLINALVTLVGDIEELTADEAVKSEIKNFWDKYLLV